MVAYTVLFGYTKEARKEISVCYPKQRPGFRIIHDENNMLTDDGLSIVSVVLKSSMYACLYIRNEHHGGFTVLNIEQKCIDV